MLLLQRQLVVVVVVVQLVLVRLVQLVLLLVLLVVVERLLGVVPCPEVRRSAVAPGVDGLGHFRAMCSDVTHFVVDVRISGVQGRFRETQGAGGAFLVFCVP